MNAPPTPSDALASFAAVDAFGAHGDPCSGLPDRTGNGLAVCEGLSAYGGTDSIIDDRGPLCGRSLRSRVVYGSGPAMVVRFTQDPAPTELTVVYRVFATNPAHTADNHNAVLFGNGPEDWTRPGPTLDIGRIGTTVEHQLHAYHFEQLEEGHRAATMQMGKGLDRDLLIVASFSPSKPTALWINGGERVLAHDEWDVAPPVFHPSGAYLLGGGASDATSWWGLLDFVPRYLTDDERYDYWCHAGRPPAV